VSTSIVVLAVFVLGAVLGGIAVGLVRARALESLRAEAASAREALARRESDLENERRAAAEHRAESERLEAKFREAFSALSAEALRSNNEAFLQLAKQSLEKFQLSAHEDLAGRQRAIGDLVSPVQQVLKEVETKLQSIEKEREGAYRALRQQVETMASTQERLKAETANLVQALRAPSVRGRWGEIHLRRVVELAGMTEHCDFEEQVSVQTEDGRQRPDLVVRLPGGKRIIVDAKVPLKAYLEAQEEADGGVREAKLAEYARQVREHVVRLGGKKYWDQFQDAPDFVVMYVPGEAFFSAALQADPELHEFGFSRKVLLTSPTNLIAILKSVYYGWQQEKVRESAQKIRDLGMELFDRLRVMAEHLDSVGTSLGRAVDAFNEVAGSFEHRVLVSARRFKDLGAASSKDLPEIEPVGRTVRALAPTDDDETPREPGGADPA
jgi:DNA recombination protein RmuC